MWTVLPTATTAPFTTAKVDRLKVTPCPIRGANVHLNCGSRASDLSARCMGLTPSLRTLRTALVPHNNGHLHPQICYPGKNLGNALPLVHRHICKMPDGANLDLDLHQYEVYVFIDDDKGPRFGSDDNVVGMFARSFELMDCDFFVRLTRSLVQRQAWAWHSSAGCGLHHDPNMRAVLKTIDKCRSRAFSYRRIERQLDGDVVLASIVSGMEEVLPQWSRFWPTQNRQARLLLWTIQQTFRSLMRGPWDIQRPKAVTFFVDNMTFFPSDAFSYSKVTNSPGMFYALDVTTPLDIEIRVISFLDRSKIPIWIQMYLGLVDGEAWLHGRFLREAPAGGISIDKQGLIYAGLRGNEAEDFAFDVTCAAKAIEEMKDRSANFGKLAPKLDLYSRYWRKWLGANRWTYNGTYWGDQTAAYPKPKMAHWFPAI